MMIQEAKLKDGVLDESNLGRFLKCLCNICNKIITYDPEKPPSLKKENPFFFIQACFHAKSINLEQNKVQIPFYSRLITLMYALDCEELVPLFIPLFKEQKPIDELLDLIDKKDDKIIRDLIVNGFFNEIDKINIVNHLFNKCYLLKLEYLDHLGFDWSLEKECFLETEIKKPFPRRNVIKTEIDKPFSSNKIDILNFLFSKNAQVNLHGVILNLIKNRNDFGLDQLLKNTNFCLELRRNSVIFDESVLARENIEIIQKLVKHSLCFYKLIISEDKYFERKIKILYEIDCSLINSINFNNKFSINALKCLVEHDYRLPLIKLNTAIRMFDFELIEELVPLYANQTPIVFSIPIYYSEEEKKKLENLLEPLTGLVG